VDGYYQVVDYQVSVGVETAMYAVWSVLLTILSIGMPLFSFKLVRIIHEATGITRGLTSSLDEQQTDLRHYVWQVALLFLFWSLSLFFNSSLNHLSYLLHS